MQPLPNLDFNLAVHHQWSFHTLSPVPAPGSNRNSSTSTTAFPTGNSEASASFTWAHAKGMPMMVMASAAAAVMCIMASHQPASTNQMMLPMVPRAPVPMSGSP